MRPIRILLADDHVMVREGTRRILEREPDLTVVAEAGDGFAAIALVEQEKPDVAVVDISMPVMNGIEATKRIKRLSPQTAVLVLTAYDDQQYVEAVLAAGAAGYLLKNARGSELIAAVRRAVNRMAPKQADHEQPVVEALSEREVEVLRLVARGLSNREIAEELVLSPYTIQNHMKSIFGKLQASSRTEAVMVGLRRGWFRVEDVSER